MTMFTTPVRTNQQLNRTKTANSSARQLGVLRQWPFCYGTSDIAGLVPRTSVCVHFCLNRFLTINTLLNIHIVRVGIWLHFFSWKLQW